MDSAFCQHVNSLLSYAKVGQARHKNENREKQQCCLFIQHILIKHLLYARSHSRSWGYDSEEETKISALVELTFQWEEMDHKTL